MASNQMFHYLYIYQTVCIILYMSILLYSNDDKTIIIRKIKLFPFWKVIIEYGFSLYGKDHNMKFVGFWEFALVK